LTKKKHAKHDKTEKTEIEETTEAGEGFFSQKNYALIFTALGALIIGVVIGILINPTITNPIAPGPTLNPINENEISETVELNEQEVFDKVKVFLDESFFEPQGGEARVSDLKKVNDYLYSVKIEFLIDGESQGEFLSYITPDNIQLINGTAFNMDEPLPTPEPPPTAEAQDIPKADKPNVKMFVMSYCPYGNQAEDGLGPVYRLLGNSIDFEPHFVYYSNYCGWGIKCQCDEGTNEDGKCNENPNYSENSAARETSCFDFEEEQPKYCSMHGVQELNEGIRETCAWKYDDHTKWWDYVDLVNANCNPENIDTCWEAYAEQSGLDVDAIKTCFDTEAETILAEEVALAEQFGVQGSPSVIINDTDYAGGRAAENYKQSICASFTEAPEECDQELGATGAVATGSC